MGTRGLKVYRFRKRYYIFYNQYDSYPDGLGQTLVQDIPADPEEYKEWLATKRQEAAEWEEQWTTYARLDPVTYSGTDKSDGQDPSTHPSDPNSSAGSSSAIMVVVPLEKVEANAEPVESAGVFCRCDRPKTQSPKADTFSHFMKEYSPAYFAPMNDIWIEWVYTIDLDLETFSVNNSAHFKLNLLPRDTWIDSLATGQQDDQIVLPGLVPPGAATSLAIDVTEKLTEQFEKLRMNQGNDATNDWEVVNPKGVDDIPWARRHEASLRGIVFALFTTSLQDMLAASLLQWSAEDLPFRELAFAILCLAAGGRNISVIAEEPSNFRTLAGSNTIVSKKSNAKEFIASLGTDFHLRGNPVGSSPEATVYWFEGALIVLKPQLFYDSVLDEGLCYIQNYCQENCPEKCVNAVLISIEHVVLVKVTPGEATQYSGLLTLVFISNHTSWDAKNRYHKTYLSKLQAKDEKFMKRHARELRKKQREKSEAMGMFGFFNDPEDEVVEDDDGYPEQVSLYRTIPDDVEGPVDPNDAFFGLAHLFEACAQQHMPPTKPSEGRLPTEIYAMILDHVYDRETRYNCREVSRTFRNLVQAHFMITDDYIFERNQAMESTIPDKAQRVTYIQRDIESGVRTKVRTMKCSDLGPDGGIKVATGPEQNRKSRLPGTDIKFVAQN